MLVASYQGCKENDLCYAPINKQFNIVLPKASLATKTPHLPASTQPVQGVAVTADSESTQLAKLFKQGSFWLIVSFFFGAGLLLAFTPVCCR